MRPVRVDVIAYAPTAFFHCQHCEITFQQLGIGARLRRIEADESLPADLRRDYLDLSDWLHMLRDRYGNRIELRVIDAASLLGVWTSLRQRVRTYPAVRVAGGRWATGDYQSLEPSIEQLAAGIHLDRKSGPVGGWKRSRSTRAENVGSTGEQSQRPTGS